MTVLIIFVLILLIVIIATLNKQSNQINNSFFSLHSKLNSVEEKLKTLEEKLAQPQFTLDDVKEEKQQANSNVEENVEAEIKVFEIIKTEELVTESVEEIETTQESLQQEVVDAILDEPQEILTESYIPKKSWFEQFKEKNPDLEKFIGENLINKIGILILVLGVSYFVKYAIDKDWINEPARVGIGILAGSLVMVIAHKLKKNFAAFSSVLVAGAISIFYFTIAIAFHEYQLFSQTVAFAIMVGITAFSVFVSVSYNRQELAVLSLIGGFAVPFMVSTGEGNYVVLFTYLAILNIGILAISYFKKWSIVTLLSFMFTTILYWAWLGSEISSNNFPHRNALLFATLFYVVFSVAIVLSNLRQKGSLSGFEYAMLVANNFAFFGFGMTIIRHSGLNFTGLFTLLLAVYNLVYAAILYNKFKFDKNAIYVLIGLTLSFATLTIPIQFKGNQITLFWAAEAVLLFWLAKKSKIQYFKLAAVLVQFLTIASLLLDWLNYTTDKELNIVLNPLFIAGAVVTISFVLSYFILKNEKETKVFTINFNPKVYTNFLFIAIVISAYFTGFLEVYFQANARLENSGSCIAFPVAYHFVFLAVLITVIQNYKSHLANTITAVISIFSIFLYIVSFYKLTNFEIVENVIYTTQNQYAFYLHYVTVIALLYLLYQVYKMATSENKVQFLSSKITPWLAVFSIVYILSCELLIHGLHFSSPIDAAKITQYNPNISSFNDASIYEISSFANYELSKTKTQIIKIGYPILWGLFSFVFLIIGIKKQSKTLRIIALSLLGLTIAKLFVYDINNASETGRIIAFILLGVLILIISFVYQKLKKLVTSDEPKKTNDEG